MRRETPNKTAPHDRPLFFIPDLCSVQAVLFLLLVAELLAIVLTLAKTGVANFSLNSLALTSLFVQWVFLWSAALLCPLRGPLSSWRLMPAAVLCYVLIIGVTVITSLAGQWLLGSLAGSPRFVADGWQTLGHSVIAAVLAGIALRYFYLSHQLQLNQQAELRSRIQALQSRIRPHFLFNSMNTIASLIAIDPQAAEEAVEDLAGLFRASLAEGNTEVTLAEELALCKRYARIEQLRLGERLELDWQFQAVPQQLSIPSLCLQPLLENAIYHGIQQLPEGGRVELGGDYDGEYLTISIRNPVADTPVESSRKRGGNRLAQDNILRRLQALYGTEAALNIRHTPGFYLAEVRYPVQIAA